MKRIHTKLALTLLLPTIIFCIGLMLLITKSITTTMSDLNEKKMTAQLNFYADQVNREIIETEYTVASLVDYTEHQFLKAYLNTDDVTQKNEAYKALSHYARLLSTTHQDGGVFIYFLPTMDDATPSILLDYSSTLQKPISMPTLPRSYFVTETLDANKSWYFEALRSHLGHWYGPVSLRSLSPSGQSVIYSQCAYANGEPYAIIGIEHPLERIQHDLKTMKYYDTGYAALLNQRQQVVSHPALKVGHTASETLGHEYAFIDQALASKDSGKLTYTWIDHRQKTLLYMPLKNDWRLVLTAYLDEVMKPSVELSQKLLILFTSVITLLAIAGHFMGLWMSIPLTHLSKELHTFTEEEDLETLSFDLRLRKDQYGKLASLFYERCRLYLEKKNALHSHMEGLSTMVEDRNRALIEANEALSEKRALIQQRHHQIKEQNHILEASINTMLHTQSQLIEQEKISSFSDIINGVAAEIDAPIRQCLALIDTQDEVLLQVSRKMLRSEYSRSYLLGAYEQVQKNNRQLVGNLMFSKDIVDYIKDLTASRTFRPTSVIALFDYLEKAKAQLYEISLDYPVSVHIHDAHDVYLETDATKFLNLVSSLLIHLSTLPRKRLQKISLHISVSIMAKDLHLRFSDLAYTDLEDTYSITEINRDQVYMGLQMIDLIMRESFFGALIAPEVERETGNIYELHFPNILYSAN